MILGGTVYRKCGTIAIPCFTTEELQRIHTLLGILDIKHLDSQETSSFERTITLGDDALECTYWTFKSSDDIIYKIYGKLDLLFEAKRVFSSEGEYFTVSTFHDGPWLDRLFKEHESENPFSPSNF